VAQETTHLQAYALVEIGDSRAIDIFLCWKGAEGSGRLSVRQAAMERGAVRHSGPLVCPLTRTTQNAYRCNEASRLPADRGWGKPANFEPLEGDPLDLAAAEKAAEEFTAKVLRLASDQESDRG
jgi:hypothetical protein